MLKNLTKKMFKLRPYQQEISEKATETLSKLKIVYLAMEVRTGKTLTSLNVAKLYGAKNVLFLTKKKAIKSIEDDYKMAAFEFKLTVMNDESLHKITGSYDLIIHDEHHRFGSFPKPSTRARLFKKMYSHLPMIFLSGTPFPESYSQVYHQFWVSKFSPFYQYTTFYKWANSFVNKKVKYLGTHEAIDYSGADFHKVNLFIENYLIKLTQKDAGFETNVIENVLYCDMLPITKKLCKVLLTDLFVKGKDETILADTGAKLQSKIHQLCSGTIKFESGNSKVIDYSKAQFIKNKFENNKIGIFYKFKEEYNALKHIYGETLTNDLETFNSDPKMNIALQVVSGREGISLKKADYLVYYNIDFSAVSYWQSRDRLTTMERKTNEIFWVFSKGGIESKIYKSVLNKKDYNLRIFKKDYGI